MRQSQMNTVDSRAERRTAEAAQARTLLLVLVCFLLGLGVGAFWYYRAAHRNPANVGETGSVLSESSRTILKTLASPVELRFYALLDPASTSEDLRNFAGRVDQMLSEYEQEAGGKIKVTRHTAQADASAASSDGIKAFNLAQGDACFLGVAIICNTQKETLGQLSPDWETALESDLSRAIARVSAAKPAARSATASTATIDAAAVAEVKRAIPNVETVSLAEGTQTLRVTALKEIIEATEEMQQRIKEAQQRIGQAQTNGTEVEQQTAVKQLQQVQAEQTEKLKDISAKLQDQIQALEQMKRK
jgi:hypothetical protein